MTKEEILKEVRKDNTIPGRNSMGCSESWYNPYYAIQQTFADEELDGFSEETLNALVKLGNSMSEAFY